METFKTKAYGARGSFFSILKPMTIERTPPGSDEILTEILAMHRRSVAASLIGIIAESQEVLDFCAKHQILRETELIEIKDNNEDYDKMLDNEVRYR